jgi:anti-sigma factor RsiW
MPANSQLSDELLLAYVEGKITDAEQHRVELWLQQSAMNTDMLEGLKELPPAQTRQLVNTLHSGLQKQLRQKHKKGIQNNSFWMSVIIVLILLLCALAYIVIYVVLKNKP